MFQWSNSEYHVISAFIRVLRSRPLLSQGRGSTASERRSRRENQYLENRGAEILSPIFGPTPKASPKPEASRSIRRGRTPSPLFARPSVPSPCSSSLFDRRRVGYFNERERERRDGRGRGGETIDSTYYYGLFTRRALTSKVVLTRLHVLPRIDVSPLHRRSSPSPFLASRST